MKLIEVRNFITIFFQSFPNNKNNKLYSRNTSLAAVFAECFIRTMRDLLKRAVFEKCFGNWIDVLPTMTKQNINRVLSTIKLKPIEASLNQIEGIHQNFLTNEGRYNQSLKLTISLEQQI